MIYAMAATRRCLKVIDENCKLEITQHQQTAGRNYPASEDVLAAGLAIIRDIAY